ncbi:MAG: hypothetical protein H0T60_17225 [Acidobacteria bacterium]|nr:hypothetical protein [Acidobacteriota bacterium]
MKFNISKKAAALVAGLVLMALPTGGATTAQRPLPNPVLMFIGPEYVEISGKQWTRYRYAVDNASDYPNELFAASPDLPPCGVNTKAARTWVDIYDSTGKRLNGFCALGSRDGLGKLWFALESGVIPPSWIYIELNDRKTATKYKSGLAETTD